VGVKVRRLASDPFFADVFVEKGMRSSPADASFPRARASRLATARDPQASINTHEDFARASPPLSSL
jgi:hypothetical protein